MNHELFSGIKKDCENLTGQIFPLRKAFSILF